MKNLIIKYLFSITIIGLMFSSCDTTDLSVEADPNNPPASELNAFLLLNSIQVELADFFEGATEAGGEVVRLEYMLGEYNDNFNNTNSSNQTTWETGYADLLFDIQSLLEIAPADQLYVHSGMARTIKAYVLMTLVDYFGDVPYTEALQAESDLIFPVADSGASVYQAAFEELDLALADFALEADANPNNIPLDDLYYNGDVDQWIKLVNTLKFKYYLNLRLIDPTTATTGINALLADGNLITSAADNFLFQYSTIDIPLSKHPYYLEEYDSGTTSDYITNYLIWEMTEEKGIDDPRLRFYTYRQVNSFPTDPATLTTEIECWDDPYPTHYNDVDPNLPFCALFDRGDGYWGRDHGNNAGIPPDNTKRTTFGVYPIGGRFDDNDATRIREGEGLNGAGIWPIMMNSYVYFMRAEAAIYLGTSDDAKTMLEMGVSESINYVTGFLPNPGNFDNIPTATDITDYQTFVSNEFDTATTADEQMAVVGKEYHIALFGNGVEGYNLYRRTGTPTNLQPTLLNLGNFPRSMLYPSIEADVNPNIDQKPNFDILVFWDNGSANVQ